jgi:cytochrome c oxidase cbb3-type subunit III
MGVARFLVTFAALSALYAPAGAWAQSRPLSSASPAQLAAGRTIFDAQCAVCHGAEGSGGSAPDLRRPLLFRARDDEALVGVIRDGIPGTPMPFAFLHLSDGMIWQTAAYVRSLGAIAPEAVSGRADRGAAVFDRSGCHACHAVAGHGGTLGPDLSAVGARRGVAALRQVLVAPGTEPPRSLVVTAVLSSGERVRGIRLDEDVFWVHLRDASGRLHVLSKMTLARLEREPSGTLMPSYDRLPSEDLDDLVAYLTTLRGAR